MFEKVKDLETHLLLTRAQQNRISESKLDDILGPVWQVSFNTHFHILNNITHISTLFYPHVYQIHPNNITQTPQPNRPLNSQKSRFEKIGLGFNKSNTASYAFTTGSRFVPQSIKIACLRIKEPKVEKQVKVLFKSKLVVTSKPKSNH